MSIIRPVKHPDPIVSVVIPTIPENEYTIPETLRNQSINKYEVVVVSDNDLNRCEARNLGIKLAEGDIIAQTDDDCRPETTWLENIKRIFENNPNAVIVGGCLDKHTSGPHSYIGANMAYRKKKALEIGGYDEEFFEWRADTDFGWRMEIKYGAERCLFDSDLVVEHIGPLRTNINYELEYKFRKKYPVRYFALFKYPNIRFGQKIGYFIGTVYSWKPNLIEPIISIRKKLK